MLVFVVVLGGCATDRAGQSANLTPAQRELRQEADRFNQTVAEGAIAGAVIGGILGAIIADDDNRAAGAAIGAAAGAAVGGGAGYFVASQNRNYANQEQQVNAQIAAAQQDVARYRTIVQTTQQVVNQHKARIAQLNAQYSAGQVSLVQVQSEQSTMREDLTLIQSLIDENRMMVTSYDGEIESLRRQGQSTRDLQAARQALVAERNALQGQYDELLQAVSDLPAA